MRRLDAAFWSGEFVLLLLLSLVVCPPAWAQGPPYQTDDPTPVDYQHYEAYIFGGVDGTPAEYDWLGPAFEFNWGALPRIQLHAILPLGGINPTNNPIYAPAGQGARAYGITDAELGVKFGFIKQTARRPQIGTFTMFEIPTGSYAKGLGVGEIWYKLPLWVEKDEGKWTFDGGAGYTVVPQTGYKNFAYGGFLVKKEINKKLEFGVEVFSHGAEGFATPQTQRSTLMDAGGYYHFKREGLQFLFAYGHSIAGQTENYAYLGLYYTWGKDTGKKSGSGADAAMLSARGGKASYF